MADGERIAIVAGVRTPFAKRNGELREASALELGVACVAELLHRVPIAPERVDQVVFGQVVRTPEIHNIARELALDAGLALTTEGFTVARACATGYQAIVSAEYALRAKTAHCVIAGGADSVSNIPVTISTRLVSALEQVRDGESWRAKIAALERLSPADFRLRRPRFEERTTGLTVGESAEQMAKQTGVSRTDQDAFARRSHRRAALAWDAGKFDEVMALFVAPDYEVRLMRDDVIRSPAEVDELGELEPIFDPEHGSLTAGNSAPAADGASAVLMMRERTATELGLTALGFVRSHAFVAVDPREQLLIGPVEATPLALERAGLGLADMELIDLHEAFAAQVLTVLRRFEADGLGTVDMDRVNVNGGSIAFGHPFAATGARQIIQTLAELRRRGGEFAICSACAAGGQAAAIVVEAA